MGRPNVLITKKFISDEDMKKLEGSWIDNSYMKFPVLRENCDVYYLDENNERKLLLKYRKNSISNSLVRVGWDSYKDLAKPSRGRGASAGFINQDSTYWKKRNLVNLY